MKEFEAIIKLLPIVDNKSFTDGFQDACKVAIEALKMRLPKKPERSYDGYADGNPVWDNFCPSCNRAFEDCQPLFCEDCGQALDWSEE